MRFSSVRVFVLWLLISVPMLAQGDNGSTELLALIESEGKLPGIEELRIEPDGSVALIAARSSYKLYGPDGKTDAVRLFRNQACSVAEHHSSLKYQLQDVKDDVVVLVVTDRFDGTSFGEGVRSTARTIEIRPYKGSRLHNNRVEGTR
jgi:hypothetical protein